MELTKHAEDLLKKSYYQKDKDGKVIENWEGLCRRVATHLAKGDYCGDYDYNALYNIEDAIPFTSHLYKRRTPQDSKCCGTCTKYYNCLVRKEIEDKFFNLLYNQYFIVNTPSLMNSGTELGGLSACFTLPVPDSLEGIFQALKNTALTLKTGGGVGISLGDLRQEDAYISTTGGTSSGALSWLYVFNETVERVKQGGKRRGAMLAALPVHHPQIIAYIDCKNNGKTLTNFNLSVGVTNAFMEAVEKNEDYDLIEPHTGKVVNRLNAKTVFDKICDSAWHTGDPGIIFLDTINKDNPIPKTGMIKSSNPCGEFLLPPANSCTLGAINLSKIVTDAIVKESGGLHIDYAGYAKRLLRQKEIDYELFDSIISTAVRMLDNTITMNKFPIPEIEEVTLSNRPIGLGFLNLSELFIKLGLVYGSDDSLEMAETVTKYMRKKAIETSIDLAKERGAYPNFDFMDWYDVNSEYIDENKYWGTLDDKKDIADELKVRNSTVLSIAPNGSTGVIVNASSGGVEPIFAVSYKRKTVDCGDMHMVNPLFEEMMFPKHLENDSNALMGSQQFEKEKILSEIEDNSGSTKGVYGVPEKMQKLFVTAREIPYEQHIKMQAVVQKHVDNGLSKTVNFSTDATVEDVKNAYTMAHSLGCKGITIYREGSRENEVLSTKKKEPIRDSGELVGLLNKWAKEYEEKEKESGIISEPKMYATTQELLNSKANKGFYSIEHTDIIFSGSSQISNENTDEETYEDEYDYIVEPRERKDMVIGYTYKISLHGMKVYITINFNEDEMTPIETFILAGKPGDDINAIAQSIGRLVSLSLKFKVPIDEIMQQIDSMAGDEIVWMGGDKILSIPDAVAKALKWAMKKRKETLGSQPIKEVVKIVEKKDNKENNSLHKEFKDSKEIKTFLGNNKCPNCGDALVFQEGCRKCLSCDYNKCG